MRISPDFPIVDQTWQQIKTLFDGTKKKLVIQYEETDDRYFIFCIDGNFIFATEIFLFGKDPESSSPAQIAANAVARADFETNWKLLANAPLFGEDNVVDFDAVGAVKIDKSWTNFRKLLNGETKILKVQYEDETPRYWIFALDGVIFYETEIFKAGFEPEGSSPEQLGQNTADRNDFEANWKVDANRQIAV